MKKPIGLLLSLLLAAALFHISCTTSEERGQVLTMKINEQNDSLLHFDSLIITVHSKDGTFSQEVFHGELRNPSQVKGMPLDPRVGDDYTVSIVGYKGGKVGVNKEVTFTDTGAHSKDVPVHVDNPETVVVDPNLPVIMAPSDTSIAEGDSLRFRVSVKNPFAGTTTLTLKDAIPGASLDTVGRDAGDGYFTWRPTYEQGRTETYAVTFVYSRGDKKVEKITRVRVMNVNRPPKLSPIADQKVKENEDLVFRIEASDPDHDSLSLKAENLPTGASFSGGKFSWKPAEGQAGNYSVLFKAFDGIDSDRVGVLITVGNVDAPPPVTVEITYPAHDTIVNTTPITVLFTVNGAPMQKRISLKDGTNRIRIDTTILSRTGFDTVLVTLDTIPPRPPIVSGSSPTRSRTPSWTWISGGNGSGTYRYRLDNEDMSGGTLLKDSTYTASKDLDAGNHTLFVQERDAAGNWSAIGKRAVRIDTTRPAAPVVSVLPSSPTNNAMPAWSWNATGDDLSGLYRYKLDTNDFRGGGVESKNTTFTPGQALKEGAHTLFVQVQDSAGNWSNSGYAALVVDITPPGKPHVTIATSSPTNNPRPTWNIATGDGIGYYRAKLDDTNLTQGAKAGAFGTFTPDAALSHGTHMLYVQERDSAGNWSARQTASIVVDLVPPSPPALDSLPPSPLNSLQPTWSWKGGGGGMGTYRFKLDDSGWTQGADTLAVLSFKARATLPEGAHTLYVQERDTAGNWSGTGARTIAISLRKVLGTAGFSGSPVYFTSIAVSPTGVPYVAYRDDSNGGKANLASFNGSAWEAVGTAGFSSGAVDYVSLRITDAGVPIVAFMDRDRGDKLSVMRYILGSWGYLGAPGFSGGATAYSSLALSKSGVPYVAFFDGAQSGKMTVMRYGSSGWENVGSAGFSTGTVSPERISLALSATDVPYVAFVNNVNFNKSLIVMRFNGGSWENVGSTGVPASNGYNPSLVVNGEIPYVAFENNTLSDKATVMRFASGAWQNVGDGVVSVSGGYMPSIAIGPSGMPYVAFQDVANGEKATIMRFNGKAWEAVGGQGITAGVMAYPSLAVSALGIPYLSCQDGANGNKLTVLKSSFDP